MAVTKKTINRYYDIINAGVFQENDIIAFKSLINDPTKQGPEVDGLFDAFDSKLPYELTNEQKEKGLNWLKKRLIKSDGVIRDTKETREIDSRTGTLTDIVDTVKNYRDFKFTCMINVSNNPYRPSEYQPVYCLYDNKGNWFEYYVYMGLIEILCYYFISDGSAKKGVK